MADSSIMPPVVVQAKKKSNSSNHITDEELGVKKRVTSFNRNPFEFEKLPLKHEGSDGLTSKQAAELLLIHGRNELVEKITPGWKIFLGKSPPPQTFHSLSVPCLTNNPILPPSPPPPFLQAAFGVRCPASFGLP